MPLFDGVKEKEAFTSFEKPNMLYLIEGQTKVIRFFPVVKEDNAFYAHFIMRGKTGYTFECIGEDCPVCKNNKKILLDCSGDMKVARATSGFSPRVTKYIYNVLDRTLVKTCPNCKMDVNKISTEFPPQCPGCNTIIVNEKAHKCEKVKLFAFGPQLGGYLKSAQKAVSDAAVETNGDPVEMDKYDVILQTRGSGKDKETIPVPVVQNNDVIDFSTLKVYDPKDGIIHLSESEIIDLLRGVSLRDIFLARGNSTKVTELSVIPTTPEDETLNMSADEIVKSLFPD